jgi:hypothetical protein
MDAMRVTHARRAIAAIAGVGIAAGLLGTSAAGAQTSSNAVSVTIVNGKATVTDAPGASTQIVATATKGKLWIQVQGIKPNGKLEHRAVQSVPAGCKKDEQLRPNANGNPGYTILHCAGHSVVVNAGDTAVSVGNGGPGDDIRCGGGADTVQKDAGDISRGC